MTIPGELICCLNLTYHLYFYQLCALQQDEANYAERIKEAKEAQGKEDDNPNPIGNVIADEKYKIDGAVKNGAEKVKIDWHDWDQIGSDLRR